MHILKEICFITTSFPAIHFVYDSVIISREHLKKPTFQRNCVYFTMLFATIYFNKQSVVDSRKSWRVCLFQENHCGPALLKVPIYSTELVAIIFLKSTVLNPQKQLQRSHSFMVNQQREISFTFSKILNTVWCIRVNYSKFFRREIVDISTCRGDFWNRYFLGQFHNSNCNYS